MANRIKQRVSGAVSSMAGLLWQVYAGWTTAAQIPSDAGGIAKMMADPPVYLPWLLVVAGLLVLAWSFWPREDREDRLGEPGIAQTSHGQMSPNFGTVHGDVHIGASPPSNEPDILPPRGPIVRRLSQAEADVARARTAKDRNLGLAVRVAGPLPGKEHQCPESPVWKAIQHIAQVVGDSDEQGCYPEARRQFRQVAAEGRIDVWGRRGIAPAHLNAPKTCSEVWMLIEPDYWHDYKLNDRATDEASVESDHTSAEPHVSHGIWAGKYWALRVHEYQVVREWPKPSPPSSGGGGPPRPTGPNAWTAG